MWFMNFPTRHDQYYYWWRSLQTYKKCIYKTYLFLIFQVGEGVWTQMVPKLLLKEENQARCQTRCGFRKIKWLRMCFTEHCKEININCIPKEYLGEFDLPEPFSLCFSFSLWNTAWGEYSFQNTEKVSGSEDPLFLGSGEWRGYSESLSLWP